MRVTLDYGRTGLAVELPDDRLARWRFGRWRRSRRRRRLLKRHSRSPSARRRWPSWPAAARTPASSSATSPGRCRTSSSCRRCWRTLEEQGIAARGHPHPRRHRPAPAQRGRRAGGDGRPGDRRATTASRTITARSWTSTPTSATTPDGVPVWIDRRYVRADLKITTGLIEPHLMAGYSGGRKVICPGIAALETVKVWHGPRFPRASQGRLRHPGRQPGPRGEHVHRPDGRLRLHRQRLHRRPAAASPGSAPATWSRPGCEGVRLRARAWSSVPVAEPVDVVVTSCAGYPLDTTLYQAVKGLTGALPIVKQGGTIILAASLTEGIGSPEFQQLFAENPDLKAFKRAHPGQGLLRDGPVAARRAGQGGREAAR